MTSPGALDEAPATAHAAPHGVPRGMAGLMLGALGVVYGDIGTSPLYALRECFHGSHALAPTPEHVLGILSVIVWSLILLISVKYLALVLRADNRGEGGILALVALVFAAEEAEHDGRGRQVLLLLGLFGAALLYGDGMITPAISVLGAVEGLKVATSTLDPYVVPISLVILIGLFMVQRRGTGAVGAMFGPLMVVWFAALALLGVRGIAGAPEVLVALNPAYAARFFWADGMKGFLILSAVCLVITGGEALYADLGHFGRAPIRRVWFLVVLPALVLNYFGQGAMLLTHPEHAENPFYLLAPDWALYPLVVLATAAAAIASQAVITGAFSLTWSAVQLGFLPRIEVRHTSEEEIGRIYIPEVNFALLFATLALVLTFGSSSRLASAYGVAVTMTMVITTILTFFVMRDVWRWWWFAAGAVTAVFLVLDVAFVSANLVKIGDGGWFPLAIGAVILVVMTTWRAGRAILRQRVHERVRPFSELWRQLNSEPPARVRGTAVYLTGDLSGMPLALASLVDHFHSLHEQVVLLYVASERVPVVAPDLRVEVKPIAHGFFQVTVRYGFLESPNVPRALALCAEHGLAIDPTKVTYILGSETLLATERPGMAIWREKLFAIIARNAGRATEFYRLPAAQVLEIGTHIEL